MKVQVISEFTKQQQKRVSIMDFLQNNTMKIFPQSQEIQQDTNKQQKNITKNSESNSNDSSCDLLRVNQEEQNTNQIDPFKAKFAELDPSNSHFFKHSLQSIENLENYLGIKTGITEQLQNSVENKKQQKQSGGQQTKFKSTEQLQKKIVQLQAELNKAKHLLQLQEKVISDQNLCEINELKLQIHQVLQFSQNLNEKNKELNFQLQQLKEYSKEMVNFANPLISDLKQSMDIKLFKQIFETFLKRRKDLKNLQVDDVTYDQDLEQLKSLCKKRVVQKKQTKSAKMFYIPELKFVNKQIAVDRMDHPGMKLVGKVRSISNKIRMKNLIMTSKTVLKQISQFYEEKIQLGQDNQLIRDQDLPIFVFNQFFHKYGMKKVASEKFMIFALSVKQYLQIFRVNMFARLLNILDHILNYNQEEMKKYFEGMMFLCSNNNLGTNVPFSESDQRRHVPYVRAMDYVKYFSENKLSNEEIQEIRQELENLKENDTTQANRPGIVDFDIFMSKLLIRYRHVINKTKIFVIKAFRAADLDGDKTISFHEFYLLTKHIEKERFSEKFVIDIFEENFDIVKNEEKILSFDKFTAVCVDYSLFTNEKQNQFIGLDVKANEEEVKHLFIDQQLLWRINKTILQEKLNALQNHLELNTYNLFVQYFEKLVLLINFYEQFVQDQKFQIENQEEFEMKPILIGQKMLTEEFDNLLSLKLQDEKEIEELIEDEET